MTKYLSIKEAITITGKSDSTIRRIIKNMNQEQRQKLLIYDGNKIKIAKHWILNKTESSIELRVSNSDSNLIQSLLSQVSSLQKTVDSQSNQLSILLNSNDQLHNDFKIAISKIESLKEKNLHLKDEKKLLTKRITRRLKKKKRKKKRKNK